MNKTIVMLMMYHQALNERNFSNLYGSKSIRTAAHVASVGRAHALFSLGTQSQVATGEIAIIKTNPWNNSKTSNSH